MAPKRVPKIDPKPTKKPIRNLASSPKGAKGGAGRPLEPSCGDFENQAGSKFGLGGLLGGGLGGLLGRLDAKLRAKMATSWVPKGRVLESKNEAKMNALLGASWGRHFHRFWVDFGKHNEAKLASN